MSDDEAVERLVSHRYFIPDVTPLQVFNRATDPFLPMVRQHTLAVLKNLDSRGLRNHVLVITRYRIMPDDCAQLSRLSNIRLTLFTYSGIDEVRIEPYPSRVAAASLKTASEVSPRRYRTILYWRPLVPGLNDPDQHLANAVHLSRHADATIFTGLFYRDQIAAYYRANGLPEPYDDTARRKIVSEELEQRVLTAFRGHGPLFRRRAARSRTPTDWLTTTVTSASGTSATFARHRSSSSAVNALTGHPPNDSSNRSPATSLRRKGCTSRS